MLCQCSTVFLQVNPIITITGGKYVQGRHFFSSACAIHKYFTANFKFN